MAVILSGGDGKGKGGGEKGERQMERCGRLQYNISSSGGDTHILSTHSSYHTWQEKKEKDAIKLYSCSSERVLRCYAACCCVCMHACVSYRRERE